MENKTPKPTIVDWVDIRYKDKKDIPKCFVLVVHAGQEDVLFNFPRVAIGYFNGERWYVDSRVSSKEPIVTHYALYPDLPDGI